MMKHILLTIGDISITGGAERVVVNLANELCKHYKVSVCSFYRANKDLPFRLDSSIELAFIYDYAESKHKDTTGLKRLYYKNLHKFILNLKINKLYKECDCVIVSDWILTPFIKNPMTRYIKFIHMNFVRYNSRNKYFDTLIILSHKQLSTWQQYHSDVRVIPNFLLQIPSECTDYAQKVVVSVGRLSEEKGFLRLVDIWEIVMRDSSLKSWKLHIVGDGILKEKIESKIASKHLEDSITLKPFTKDIGKEYLNASIYVMTSHFEGFGMVLIESASYALPSVAFDVNTGPSDIIEDSTSGFLIQDDDLEGFADKLMILMNDKSRRKEFGQNAKNIVIKKFSKEAIMRQWIHLLEERRK